MDPQFLELRSAIDYNSVTRKYRPRYPMSKVASAEARTLSFADTLAASRGRALLALGLLAFFGEFTSCAAEASPQPGLVVTFVTKDGNRSDRTIAPNVWLH